MRHSTSFTFGGSGARAGGTAFRALAMLAAIAVLASCNADRDGPGKDPGKGPGTVPDVSYLDQGWSSDLRTRYYFDPQGSRLIPYDWFVALEQPDNDRLFIDAAYVEALGYLAAAPSPLNPDGLPVGFVKDPAENPRNRVLGWA